MAETFTFSVGTRCAGGGHVPITITNGVLSRTLTGLTAEDLLGPVDDDDLRALLRLIARRATQNLAVKSPANIKAAVEASSVVVG